MSLKMKLFNAGEFEGLTPLQAYQKGYDEASKSFNAITIPENATNGDIYIQVYKPYKGRQVGNQMLLWDTRADYINEIYHKIPMEWWETPYGKA